MCIKVLYNIKNNKTSEGGAIFEPKILSSYFFKKNDQDGIRTHDLRVRKHALLSTCLTLSQLQN